MTTSQPEALESALSGLLSRLVASVNLTTTTTQLAIAELKLAVSSAGLFVAGVIALFITLMSTWVWLLITGYQVLQWLGLQSITASALMLLAQLALCIAIVLLLLKLRTQCQFPRTREALSKSPVPDPTH